MDPLPPGGQKASSSPAPLIAAAAAVAGVVASRTTLGKVAILAAAGTAALRWLNAKRATAPNQSQPFRADAAERDICILQHAPKSTEPAVDASTAWLDLPQPEAHEPIPADEPATVPLIPQTTRIISAPLDVRPTETPVEKPFSIASLYVPPQEPSEPTPEAMPSSILPLASSVADDAELSEASEIPTSEPIAELSPELPQPVNHLPVPSAQPTWVLSMEPLPVVAETSIADLNEGLAKSDLFSPIPGATITSRLPATAPFDVPLAAPDQFDEISTTAITDTSPAEAEIDEVTDAEVASYIPPLAAGGDIPDAISFEPENEVAVTPITPVAEPVVEATETPDEPEVEAPETAVGKADSPPESAGVPLPSSHIAKLLKELAERLPPVSPQGQEAAKISLSELNAPTPAVAVAAVPATPEEKEVSSTKHTVEEPTPAVPVVSLPPKREETDIVSAAKLFADLKPVHEPVEAEKPKDEALPPDDLAKSTGPFSPKTKPRPMITIPPATSNPQRKNWLAWWK